MSSVVNRGVAASRNICRVCLALLVAVLVLGSPSRLAAQQRHGPIALVAPSYNATVSGTVTFEAQVNPRRIKSLSFYLGPLFIGSVAGSAFPSVSWDTAYAADGQYDVRLIGYNLNGRAVSTEIIPITIDNNGNSLEILSPDLGKPLRGTVTFTVKGYDSEYYPAYWIASIDGDVAESAVAYTDNEGTHTDTVKLSLDTTKYPNGIHQLYIGMHSDWWPPGEQADKTFVNWRGGTARFINIQNGAKPMAVEADYQHVYLTPGQSLSLGCKVLLTNGGQRRCQAPSFNVSNPSVARVSSDGTVTAGSQEGFATVTVSDDSLSGRVYVWVVDDLGVPQFAGNGQFLTNYTGGSSLFVISPFFLSANSLMNDQESLSALESAGVNTLSEGFYINPRTLNMSLDDFKSYYNSAIAPEWTWARENGFHILATGDEVCRDIGGEAWWTLNWANGKAAVEYAMQSLASSGVAVGVEMVDEASYLWGPSPLPNGNIGAQGGLQDITCSSGNCTVSWPGNPIGNNTEFAIGDRESVSDPLVTPLGSIDIALDSNSGGFDFAGPSGINGDFDASSMPGLQFLWWAGDYPGCPTAPCDPPVPNNALQTIAGWLHAASPHVPISWPPAGLAPVAVQGNWLGPNSLSDYASHYWTSGSIRAQYPWSSGVNEESYWMRRAFYSRQPVIMLDRPQLMEISTSGPLYQKESTGEAFFDPTRDVLEEPGQWGPSITAQMMTAAALGVAGERLYYWEDPADQSSRMTTPIGSVLQTGVNSTSDDPIVKANWDAVQSASKALQLLTPYLLGERLSSPAYGPNIVTALRKSDGRTLLLIVNTNDWGRTLVVHLRQYFKGLIKSYVVTARGLEGPTEIRGLNNRIFLPQGAAAAYIGDSR